MNDDLMQEYLEKRAQWLFDTTPDPLPHERTICRAAVAQGIIADLMYCLSRPNPKLSAKAVAHNWRTWLTKREAELAQEYEAGEIAANALPEEVLS